MSTQEQNHGRPLTLAEYLKEYDPFEPEKAGPYIPEDGAVVCHTAVFLYRQGKRVGFMLCAGHLNLEDVRKDEFIKNDFQRDLTLEHMEVGIVHERYGNGLLERDALKDEMVLISMGALQNGRSDPERRYTISRSELELAPVSPLTERGMSRFLTAVAELAEGQGLEVRGIDNGCLQLYRNGLWAFDISESGGGSMSMLEYRPDLAAQGMTDAVLLPSEDSGCPFMDEVHRLRREIPEVLYPKDYALAEQEVSAQESGMEMIM